jgi:hypothetical protein
VLRWAHHARLAVPGPYIGHKCMHSYDIGYRCLPWVQPGECWCCGGHTMHASLCLAHTCATSTFIHMPLSQRTRGICWRCVWMGASIMPWCHQWRCCLCTSNVCQAWWLIQCNSQVVARTVLVVTSHQVVARTVRDACATREMHASSAGSGKQSLSEPTVRRYKEHHDFYRTKLEDVAVLRSPTHSVLQRAISAAWWWLW